MKSVAGVAVWVWICILLGRATPAFGQDWTLELPAYVASHPSRPVVVRGTIGNRTGKDLVLAGASVGFGSEYASYSPFAYDLAPELLGTQLVIPPGGYSGPVLVVSWKEPRAFAIHGVGALALHADSGVRPSTYDVSFAVPEPAPTLLALAAGSALMIVSRRRVVEKRAAIPRDGWVSSRLTGRAPF